MMRSKLIRLLSFALAGLDGVSVQGVHPVALFLPVICQVSVPPSEPTLALAWLHHDFDFVDPFWSAVASVLYTSIVGSK